MGARFGLLSSNRASMVKGVSAVKYPRFESDVGLSASWVPKLPVYSRSNGAACAPIAAKAHAPCQPVDDTSGKASAARHGGCPATRLQVEE